MKRKLIENYSLGEVLGEGSFGKVYKALHTITNQEFAVKAIPVQRFQQNSRLETCSVNEIENLTKIESNPFIIKFIQILKTTNNLYFVYEYCNGKTLEARLKQEKRISEPEGIRIFNQLIEAFKVLNKYNIMHRDLKPDNIFFHNGDIKLGDFGFCKTLMTKDDMTSTMLGSPIYMAPEVLRGEIYTSKADIWSLGVVLYEMMYGSCPFESSSIAKLIGVLDNEELKFPQQITVSQSTKNLIRKLLIKDQFKRIEWFELLTLQQQKQKQIMFSFTQSLSGRDSEGFLKRFGSSKQQSLPSTEYSQESSQQSSTIFNSYQPLNPPQKGLTFRKKSEHITQNLNKIDKNAIAKSHDLCSNPESPRPICEPFKKLQINISESALQRNLSTRSTKRKALLQSHNFCLQGMKTALSFLRSGEKNSSLYGLLILRRVEYMLQNIIGSVQFSQLQLQDIISTCSEQGRQMSKQISALERHLRQSRVDPLQTINIKDTLRAHHDNQINKKLWYEMISFLNEQIANSSLGEQQHNAIITQYLSM